VARCAVGTEMNPETVIRVRGLYTSGAGPERLKRAFNLTEQELLDILHGKYGRGSYAKTQEYSQDEHNQSD